MNSFIKAAMLTAGVLLVSAESARAETLEVKIPFDFTVGAQKLPAGEYRLERESQTSTSVLLLRGEHGNTAQMFLQTVPVEDASRGNASPAFVFVQGEDRQNHLVEIWESGRTGHEISVSHAPVRVIGQIVVRGEGRS